ncbi:hypothetical protein LguiB_000774 [Lonicera macranthoides]
MLSELDRRPINGGNEGSFSDEMEKEIGLLLREQRRQEADDREKELNLFRSGSAPPTVEGSLSAVGGLFNHGGGTGTGTGGGGAGAGGGGGGGGLPFSGFGRNKSGNGFMSDEELRSDPAYLSYYYSNVNLNPRLPPPTLSKEDWRFAQRLQGGSSAVGGIGDRRKVNMNDTSGGGGGISLFSMPPGFNSKKLEGEGDGEKVQVSAEWGGDGLIGLPGLGLGSKQKSLAEIFQDDLSRSTTVSRHPSRPASRNTFDNTGETLGSAEDELAQLHRDLSSSDVQHVGPPSSYSYAAVLGASLSRSTTPDPQHIARAPSPCPTPIGGGRVVGSEKRSLTSNTFNGVSTQKTDPTDLVAALSGMNLSNGLINGGTHLPSQIEQDVDDHDNYLFNNLKQHSYLKKSESGKLHMPSAQSAKGSYSSSGMSSGGGGSDPNKPYLKGTSGYAHNGGGSLFSAYQHVEGPNSPISNYGVNGYSMNPSMPSMMSGHLGNFNLPPLFENAAAASAMAVPGMDPRMLGASLPSGSNLNSSQAPFVDPMYLQYLTTAEYAAAQAAGFNDFSEDRNYNSYMDLLQKAYLGSLASPQKSQYSVPFGSKTGGSNNHGYYGSPPYAVGLSYPGSPLASPVIQNSHNGPFSPMRHGELNMRSPSGVRSLAGGVMAPWHLDSGYNMDNNFASSLLEEFKSNKTKCFELSEIAGHVVEFSADQYGSRFIQQKLETATTEEKTMVFEEINPQALTLMTDVFGNYVIQKFFEHGLASQRREFGNKLFGHVLTLSLQMYGCRVIQKAIEVVDMDQKIKMVEELDGHIMRCVRDQNGNHVIQKCIECVPEDHIKFIISTFCDQVVTLSTHPYGCRVIQRILDHCSDPKTQSKVMDEIMGSVSMLAQDQYGNYVIQHVLEHGKPHERSTIIQELAGKIVQMSQQKFASNVVEKCLTFGDPTERQLLVNEMLGTTDENEPLQAMMKDQFANYVVQKVLETCSDQQRELIMSRIKVHLNALKKYTYGKHIVARVEKLITAGERRIAAGQFQHPA